ncbi:MAG: hypothetical protein ACPGSC_15430, partial [Granulosicoccaceae bacterium]
MDTSRSTALISAFCLTLFGCVGSGENSATVGPADDGSNTGFLVIGENHPTLSNQELLSFRAAQALTTRYELTIGGQTLTEEKLDSTRSFFTYSGFPRNTQRDFSLSFFGEFQGRQIELLAATGKHTFKTYVASTCVPNREDDCSQVEQSDDNSTSIEQQLEIQAIVPQFCDNDSIDNLTEMYFNTDPCGSPSEQPLGELTAATPAAPVNNAVLERASSYGFEFSTTIDSLHTHYFVHIYAGESDSQLVGSSNRTPVLANQTADYFVSANLNLAAGGVYNWRIFGA